MLVSVILAKTDWSLVLAIPSAATAIASTTIAWWVARSNRDVIEANKVMAAANVQLVQIEIDRRREEQEERATHAAAARRANLRLVLRSHTTRVGLSSGGTTFSLLLTNDGPARARRLSIEPVALTGAALDPAIPLPAIVGGTPTLNLVVGESVELALDGIHNGPVLKGLECFVRWTDDAGDHEERVRTLTATPGAK